ncbi:NAD(P)/FAD-dependent oxidoreductase [Paenibacillus sp. GP183]|uniref:NAD(P)/FAD-dependent oxidoreductase n=1 Tax=Paenibacillus sp. GP183 TaxID=1882751 RepID=UPI0008967045|nr:NAD(P)/FAD-dependent oxidoreductase [Paenibacillus sp. GP183]SEB94905.1 Thioredoxin reductase [Paenibacillus sp. GP183]
MAKIWDSLIVGGGIAGLQAAIQLGRYGDHVIVIDSGYGRSTLCRSYHNILGWPDGVSGEELRSKGRKQAESFGVEFVLDEIVEARNCSFVNAGENVSAIANFNTSSDANPDPDSNIGSYPTGAKQGRFELVGKSGERYWGQTLLLATGLLDRFPNLPGLVPCFGMTVYVCPDCDGFEIKDKSTIIMGAGDVGAEMALLLADSASEMVYVNHERKQVKAEALEKLKHKGINHVQEEIAEVLSDGNGKFEGVKLVNGKILDGERGFIAFGGNHVKSELAKQLGVERLENRHLLADPRTKMTNVRHVWAAGDVGVHAEQVTIAMGEGTQAAVWMHKALVKSQAAF